MTKQKIKTSSIFFITAFALLLILVGPYVLPFAIVGAEVGGIKIFVEGISERNAVLIFLILVSTSIGIYLKSKRK